MSVVLIVGGGIAGLSTAAWLARAGVECVLFEAADACGTHATAQNAAILRTLVPSAAQTAIGRASLRHLAEPPAEFVAPLIDPRGLVLTAAPGDGADLAAWAAAAGPCAATPVHALDAAELQERAPHVQLAPVPEGAPAALWLPREGVLDIAALAAGFERQARSGATPARLLTGAEVVACERTAGGAWSVELADGRRFAGDALLLTGGAWAGTLAKRVGSDVRFAPRRRHLAVALAGTPTAPVQDLPVVWHHATGGPSFYVRPEVPGLLLSACDETLLEPAGSPATERCPRDPEVLEALARVVERHLPGWADARVHSWWAGWRTFDADDAGRFVIGPDPSVPGLFWAAGLGGHGMTASFEVGRLAAAELAAARGAVPAILDGDDYGHAFRPSALCAGS